MGSRRPLCSGGRTQRERDQNRSRRRLCPWLPGGRLCAQQRLARQDQGKHTLDGVPG